tara:strand:+ start:128031 stop:130130 length:2100 start_codon:yes stop_codon:yes gene_type:complete
MRYNTKSFLAALSVTTILTFSTAYANEDNFSLLADDVQYSEQGTKVVAKGNVTITSDRGNLRADSLTYNTNTGILLAQGNITYIDVDNITIYLDEIELKDELKSAVLKNLRIRIGKVNGEGPKLAAEKATKTRKNVITLENAVYSPCTECASDSDDDLPWKIRAGKIEYNEAAGTATYDDAILDVYGVPVIYVPYFKHSVVEKAEDGILTPRFGSSTSRGFELKTGYYKRVSPNQDITTRLRYMTKRGVMIQPEHRYSSKNLYSDIKVSAIEDENTHTWRSNAKSEIEYVFQKGRRAGLNLDLASDDYYLDEFFDENPSHTKSTAYIEDASPNHYYAATASFYQDQTVNSDDDKTAQVMPQFVAERTFKFDHNKTNNLTVSANVLNLARSEGTKSNRLVTEVEYRDIDIYDDGSRIDFAANVRADIYNINTDTYSTSGKEGISTRILPQISLQWEKPFISQSTYHKITPKAMLVVSPRGSNPDEIPNEDSVAYELDTSNLFDTNRFAGYDRIESGTRFIYGLDNEWGAPGDIKWHTFFGQSYRFFDDADLPQTGGTETQISDWVGVLEGSPMDSITFSTKFRLDNASFETRRIDTTATWGDTQNTFLQGTHSQLENGPEEFKISGRYRFNKTWDFEGEVQKDLDNGGRILNSEGEINYTHQCYRLSFKARRRGFDSVNVTPSTDYTLNLELLTLGRDEE